MQNLLRRFCKRRIQKPEFSIQNGDPLSGRVFSYSDSCILTPDFSLANTPEGFCKSLRDLDVFSSFWHSYLPDIAEPDRLWNAGVRCGLMPPEKRRKGLPSRAIVETAMNRTTIGGDPGG